MLLEETKWVNYLVLTKAHKIISRQELPAYLEHSLNAYPLTAHKKAITCYWLGSMYEETGNYIKAVDFFRQSVDCYRIDMAVNKKRKSQREKKAALIILLKLAQVLQELKETIVFATLRQYRGRDITQAEIRRKDDVRELTTLCEFNSNAHTDVSRNSKRRYF